MHHLLNLRANPRQLRVKTRLHPSAEFGQDYWVTMKNASLNLTTSSAIGEAETISREMFAQSIMDYNLYNT